MTMHELAICLAILSASPPSDSSVIPTPQLERNTGEMVCLSSERPNVLLQKAGDPPTEAEAVRLGINLIRARLRNLGSDLQDTDEQRCGGTLIIEYLSNDRMLQLLRESGTAAPTDPRRLRQAYVLRVEETTTGFVLQVSACSGLGAYYGLLSACQLLDSDENGRIRLPVTTLFDWPECPLRLAKTSASENRLETIEAFSVWLPAFKLDMLGLQYHGDNSKTPEPPFFDNVESLCPRLRKEGLLETVVYFCPFRGGDKSYDFRQDEDRAKYAELLRWILAQGAHGVEIDYNDWPDKTSGVPVEDVINLACGIVDDCDPDVHVLFCPSLTMYRGMAKPELSQTLSRIPERVRPLWTGRQTLIDELPAEDVEQWTKQAGRRPFLWVNRVFLHGQFCRFLPDAPDVGVFRGEALPRELNRLFAGVHFNAGLGRGYNRLPRRFTPQALAYLATAADFLWNPKKWQPERSAANAARLVEIMTSLLGPESMVGLAGKTITSDHPDWRPVAGRWEELDGCIVGQSDGRFAVLLARTPPDPSARIQTCEATVQTLNMVGNRNGYLVFGRRTESEEYLFAGIGFASRQWMIMQAKAGAQTQRVLCQADGDIATGKPHSVQVKLDCQTGDVELREFVEGNWIERLRCRLPDPESLVPVAGLGIKWGATEFADVKP